MINQGAQSNNMDGMPNNVTTDFRSLDNFGARLLARRERFGMSVKDVSEATHVRPEYITAIERLDQDALPAIGYTLGYVRSYAKALGMDGDVAVKDYKSDVALTQLPLRDAPHVVFRRQFRLPRGFVSAMSVASAALLVGVWYGTQSEAIATPAPALNIAPQFTAHTPAAPIMQDGLFTLRTTSPSWIQISDAQGTVQISRIFITGETWQGPTAAGYSVSVRDAGAVELYDGAELLGTLGQAGEPITGYTLSQDLPGTLPQTQQQSLATSERP